MECNKVCTKHVIAVNLACTLHVLSAIRLCTKCALYLSKGMYLGVKRRDLITSCYALKDSTMYIL